MLRGKRGPLIAGALVIVVIVLAVMFFVLPKMNQVSEANDELAAAQAQTGTLESQLIALGQAEAEAPEAEAVIRDVDQKIPPTADLSSILLLVKNAASQSGVTVTTLTPGVPVLDPATGLSTIPLALEGTGTYFSLAEFLYRLETLPRAAKVQSVQLSPDSGGDDAAAVTTGTLRLVSNVQLFTTDASAGPGSDPAATSAEPGATSPAGTGGAT
ncbi:MAG TPA: type 4a pilus biogenesis protein PilO [Actinomycetota bacterium]